MRVLAISARPGDAEMHCGGTLAKCVRRGDEVFVCHLSDGGLGSDGTAPEKLGEIRCREAENAAKAGGYTALYGGFHDLDIYPDNKAARDRVTEIIRRINPDFIITHFPQDSVTDLAAVSKLVFDASFCATVPHYKCGVEGATEVVPIFYMSPSAAVGFIPAEFVDVTAEKEIRKNALLCHKSLIEEYAPNGDPVDDCEIEARFFGRQSGVEYAEGFCQCQADMKLRTVRLLP